MANLPESASNVNAALRALADKHILPVTNEGAPVNGTSGTGAGYCGKGTLLIDSTNGVVYLNTGTKASPTWDLLGSIALTVGEIAYLAGVVAGTVTASKAVVVDAQKAVDTLRATGTLNIGGTGVPGAASVETTITKAVTAFSDTVAKDVFTVTVPNAAHAAIIELNLLGVLGAGGAIGAGEGSRVSKYQLTLARTVGVAVVATLSAAIGGAESHVAGAASVTSVVATLSAISGAVSATNTFTVKVAITKSGGASDNHTCVASARVLNQNATGVTIA